MRLKWKLIKIVILALLVSSNMPNVVRAAPGSTDASFGIGGKVTTDFTGQSASANAAAIQPDGKIVVAGQTLVDSSGYLHVFALARYNQDGGLDTTFGVGGKVTTSFTDSESAFAIALQSDGKIIAAGQSAPLVAISEGDFALARYNADGSLDASFGSGGKVTTRIFGHLDSARAIAIQADGKIIVGGFAAQRDIGSNINGSDFALVRYKVDGSLDATFGDAGRVTTHFHEPTEAKSRDEIHALAIQADGCILTAGIGGTTPFGLTRYDVNGSLDKTFNTTGEATGEYPEANAIAIQGDGRIVLAGDVYKRALNNYDFAVVRYNGDGSRDTTFGSAGQVTTDFFDRNDEAHALAVQEDGRIVAVGFSFNGTSDFALARYTSNGDLDATFGSGGKTVTDFFGKSTGSQMESDDDVARAVLIQRDGKIVAAGQARSSLQSLSFALARYDATEVAGDFSLSSDTAAQGILAGTAKNFTITAQPAGRSSAINPVTLSTTITPPNATISLNLSPSDINLGGSAVATVSTTANTPPGDYYISVIGRSGQISRSATVRVSVFEPDFALTSNVSAVTAQRATRVRVTITISRFSGFTGSVNITPPDTSGQGIKVRPPEALTTTGDSAAFKLKITEGAATGGHELTFTGTDDSGRVRSFKLLLTVL